MNKFDFSNGGKMILIVVIIIIIIGTVYNSISNETGKTPIKWANADAINEYHITKMKYGTPSIVDFSTGGIAIWTKEQLSDTCFERIELLDESIPHCVPRPHRDFLYSYVNYEIPNDKIMDILSLSGSVSYDPLKKFLRARCGSEEANIATLYLAVSIGNNRISIENIHRNKLYEKTIISTGNPQNVQIYYERLCKYISDQPGNKKWTGFFPVAFPKGCCKGYDPNLNKCGIENFSGMDHAQYEHTLEDHLSGKITDHTTEEHLADKTDKGTADTSLKPVIV